MAGETIDGSITIMPGGMRVVHGDSSTYTFGYYLAHPELGAKPKVEVAEPTGPFGLPTPDFASVDAADNSAASSDLLA